jgi:hypothetical protein
MQGSALVAAVLRAVARVRPLPFGPCGRFGVGGVVVPFGIGRGLFAGFFAAMLFDG